MVGGYWEDDAGGFWKDPCPERHHADSLTQEHEEKPGSACWVSPELDFEAEELAVGLWVLGCSAPHWPRNTRCQRGVWSAIRWGYPLTGRLAGLLTGVTPSQQSSLIPWGTAVGDRKLLRHVHALGHFPASLGVTQSGHAG